MSYDNHGLFADSLVLVAPVPALTGTELTLVAGGGALMPAAPFNATVGPVNTRTSRSNSEVVRVTQIVGDVITIARAQEGSTARSIIAGDYFSNTITPKVVTDIEAAIGAIVLYSHGADIASASTINLTAATGDLVDVTGTTTITAITLSDGLERTVRFTGALTLTNGASLVLPGGANITTVAGDFAIFRGYAAGVVRCVAYAPIGVTGTGKDVKDTSPTLVTPSFSGNVTGSSGATWFFNASTLNNVGGGVQAYAFNADGYIAIAGLGLLACRHANGGVAFGGGDDIAFRRTDSAGLEINNNTIGVYRDLKLRNLYPTGGNGLASYTVATLPASAATGMFEGASAWVTDALAPSSGAAVAGGGAVKCEVQYNGTSWLVIAPSHAGITGSGALTIAAGGSNQNITLTPSGTGIVSASSAVRGPDGTQSVPTYSFTNSTGLGMYQRANVAITFATAGNKDALDVQGGTITIPSTSLFGWASGAQASGAIDTGFGRNAAGIVEVNSGNAGIYRDLKLRALIATGQSLTGAEATPILDLAATWNTSGTPTALKVNVTDTASGETSSLADFQVGGVTKASIRKGGTFTGYMGYSDAGIRFGNGNNNHVVINRAGQSYSPMLYFYDGGGDSMVSSMASKVVFGWSTDIYNADTSFSRISAGLIGVGTGAQGSYAGDLKLRNLYPTGGNGLASFTVATLPATAATGMFTGAQVYCTDETGGAIPVFYDGTNWRRVSDRAIAA